ncbi:MAG: ABC transporter ATP-binding protein, partial [Rhodospirillaceae bacterium]|nr:ABC transporter ATP-binding protein [Rhodospirillaceae bacterium]
MKLLIRHTRLFTKLVGAPRLAAFVGLTLLTGLTDGIGLALVVPLLEIGAGSSAVPSVVSQVVTDTLATVGLTPTLPLLVLILIVVFAVKALFIFIAQVTVAFMQVSLRERLRLEVIDHALAARLPHVLRTRVGTLSNLFTEELNGTINNMLNLTRLASTGILFTIYVTGALVADWRSGAVALVVATLVLTVFFSVNRRTRILSRNVSDRNARILDLALQSFNNIKFLKATHTHTYLRDRLQRITDERQAFLKWQEALKTLVQVAMEPFAITVIAAFVLFSVVVRGETLATALLPILFLYRAVGRAGEMQDAWHRFCATAGPVDAFETTRHSLAEKRERFPTLVCPPLRRAITLTGVSYGCGETGRIPVLKDVSLEIPARGIVGITGPTGAGKTTCVDILCGLLRPSAGRIAWDDQDYAELDLMSLRSRIGYVTQDTEMIKDSITNYINLWD